MNYSINQYYQYFCEKHDASFELLDGSGVVMFSAPHSVEQTRMGKSKCGEIHGCNLQDVARANLLPRNLQNKKLR